jgi:hypothetical protein
MSASDEDQLLWIAENELNRQQDIDNIRASRAKYKRDFRTLLGTTLLGASGVGFTAVIGSFNLLPGGGVVALIVLCSLVAIAAFITTCFTVENNKRDFDQELRDAVHKMRLFRNDPKRVSGEAPMTDYRAEKIVMREVKNQLRQFEQAAAEFSGAAKMLRTKFDNDEQPALREWKKIHQAEYTSDAATPGRRSRSTNQLAAEARRWLEP